MCWRVALLTLAELYSSLLATVLHCFKQYAFACVCVLLYEFELELLCIRLRLAFCLLVIMLLSVGCDVFPWLGMVRR